MNVFENDIDKNIQQLHMQIEELEQLKKDQHKKFEGIEEFDTVIKRLCNQNSLTEEELYVSRSEMIESWIVGMAKEQNPSSIYGNLRKHFERRINRGEKKEKKSTLPKPTLPVGEYRNPATQEKIQKIKRNPKQLDNWIAEFGLEIVKTWKV